MTRSSKEMRATSIILKVINLKYCTSVTYFNENISVSPSDIKNDSVGMQNSNLLFIFCKAIYLIFDIQ